MGRIKFDSCLLLVELYLGPMPAALNVDREAVRTLVVAVGVREAARQMGISEDTVSAWSARGNWIKQKAAAKLLAIQSKPLQAFASKPADALANALADDSKVTKLGLSKATRTASASLAKMPGEKVLKHSRALVDVTKTAAVLHGWTVQPAGGSTIALNILTGSAQVLVQDKE